MRMIEPMVKYGVKSLEVKPEAEEEFNSDLHGKMKVARLVRVLTYE